MHRDKVHYDRKYPPMIFYEINALINAHPTVEEDKVVVFELTHKSACGPQGFTCHFINNWGFLFV